MTQLNAFLDPPVVSHKQCETGANWYFTRTIRATQNEQMYNHDYTPLLYGVKRTLQNGLALLSSDADLLMFPWPRLITDFYVDSLLAERPIISSSDSERAAFIKGIQGQLCRVLRRAIQEFSWGGYCTIAVTVDGRMMAIPSRFYHPLKSEINALETVGHLLTYMWYDWTDAPRQLQTIWPNRLRKIYKEDDAYQVKDFYLSGTMLGASIGEAPADISHIFAFGDGRDEITHVRNLMLAQAVARTLWQYGVVKHQNPIISGPSQVATEITAVSEEADISTDEANILWATGTPYIPVEMEDAPIRATEIPIQSAASQSFVQRLQEEIFMATGIPPSALGLNPGKGESGSSRLKLMHAAMSKALERRNEIEAILPPLIDAMGAPPGPTSTTWVADPFASLSERVQAASILKRDKILVNDEIRGLLGYAASSEDAEPEAQG